MSQEIDPLEQFRAYLAEVQNYATKPLVLTDEQQEVYFNLFKGAISRIFFQLADEVARKGDEGPLMRYKDPEPPEFYTYHIEHDGSQDGGYLSVGIRFNLTPIPFTIEQTVVGQEKARISVFDGANSINFHLLDNRSIVCTNANIAGSERLLDSAGALFEPVPCNPVFPVGNPAAWINKLVQTGMLNEMKEKLAVLSDRREIPG